MRLKGTGKILHNIFLCQDTLRSIILHYEQLLNSQDITKMWKGHVLQQTELFEMQSWTFLALGLKGKIRCGAITKDFDDFSIYS